jgi:hypothetical protein
MYDTVIPFKKFIRSDILCVTSEGGSFMFNLKVSKSEHKIIKERLNLVETVDYDYVLTDDKELTEDDKINIVFGLADIVKVSNLLDLIVKGEELYIVGSNEFGQKSVESRNFYYFIVEEDDVYGVLSNTRMLIKSKLYEIETLLENKNFIRISKYCLVNIGKIDYIKPALNSKLDLLLKNKEHLEVNRGYYKDFKKALEI